MLRPLWIAFRAAFLATAVFWVALYIVEKSGLQVPLGLEKQAVFFVVFFFGVLWVR